MAILFSPFIPIPFTPFFSPGRLVKLSKCHTSRMSSPPLSQPHETAARPGCPPATRYPLPTSEPLVLHSLLRSSRPRSPSRPAPRHFRPLFSFPTLSSRNSPFILSPSSCYVLSRSVFQLSKNNLFHLTPPRLALALATPSIRVVVLALILTAPGGCLFRPHVSPKVAALSSQGDGYQIDAPIVDPLKPNTCPVFLYLSPSAYTYKHTAPFPANNRSGLSLDSTNDNPNAPMLPL